MYAYELDQIAQSFQSIRFMVVAITVCMVLYVFVLVMGFLFVVRKRRGKVRSVIPEGKQAPKPEAERTNYNERASARSAVKVEGTYIGNQRSGKIDVESFLTQSCDEPKPIAEAPPQEAEAYIETEPELEAKPELEIEQEAAFDAATGNLFAEALKHATGADIAFLNSGGIRSPLGGAQIMEADITQIFPFDDTVTVQGLTEAQIKAVLEHSAETLPQKDGRYLRASGIVAELDMAMPTGERVVSVTLANGEALRGGAEYIVAANAYIADGGDGYDMLAAVLPKMSEGQTVVQAVLEYITDIGTEGLSESENIIIRNAG